MPLSRSPVRFSGRRLSIRLTDLCSYTTTHPAPQNLRKPIDKSPNASLRRRRFFKSISSITSSLAKVSSVQGSRTFVSFLSTRKITRLCNYYKGISCIFHVYCNYCTHPDIDAPHYLAIFCGQSASRRSSTFLQYQRLFACQR